MKHLICTVTRREGEKALNGIGEYGHYMTAVNRGGNTISKLVVRDRKVVPYLMHLLDGERNKYSAAPDTSIYTAIQIRKKLINAFQKYAVRWWDIAPKKARKWARLVADYYFNSDGRAIDELIETFSDWYGHDYSQESFDDYVATEIQYW